MLPGLDPDAVPMLVDRAELEPSQRWWEHSNFDELLAPGEPCPTCGGLAWWENVLGARRCLTCDRAAFDRSNQLESQAAELRKRATSDDWR